MRQVNISHFTLMPLSNGGFSQPNTNPLCIVTIHPRLALLSVATQARLRLQFNAVVLVQSQYPVPNQTRLLLYIEPDR